jgi:FkbM family methyltransferase
MQDLIKDLSKVERLSNGTKFKRLLSKPFKYILATTYLKLLYPLTKKGIIRKTKTFFNKEMYVVLPAGADIYLIGGKSHDSEIRLAKFIIMNLGQGDTFIDVGAHFGYFTLLASKIVSKNGKVAAFEASKNTFSILKKNTDNIENIKRINKAISNINENLTFFEFPVLYSEYNSFDIEQFKKEKWITKFQPAEITIKAITLDSYITSEKLRPKIIKIDVEGAEFKVLQGLRNFLITDNDCCIVVEYLNPTRHNTEHRSAKSFIENLGYSSYIIDKQGSLSSITDIDEYLVKNNLESENVVFKIRR